jgi:hypothetical protein
VGVYYESEGIAWGAAHSPTLEIETEDSERRGLGCRIGHRDKSMGSAGEGPAVARRITKEDDLNSMLRPPRAGFSSLASENRASNE